MKPKTSWAIALILLIIFTLQSVISLTSPDLGGYGYFSVLVFIILAVAVVLFALKNKYGLYLAIFFPIILALHWLYVFFAVIFPTLEEPAILQLWILHVIGRIALFVALALLAWYSREVFGAKSLFRNTKQI